MDPRERGNPFEEALKASLDGRQAQIYTAMPGVIRSFNAAQKTAVVQPAIKATANAPDGSTSQVALPLLLDCPVHFPSGGGATLTFPVAQGDECLVVFASRCIDAWWQSGGIQAQAEMRMHDLSDGFAIVGVSSVPNVPTNISTTSTQLRSNDGATVIDLNPGDRTVTITAPAGVVVNGNLSTSGNVSVGTGASGSFTTPTGQTVTIRDGIITNIF